MYCNTREHKKQYRGVEFFMHITKQVNGLYKVEYKGLAFPLYVESYDQAIEIVWKLAGVNNGK